MTGRRLQDFERKLCGVFDNAAQCREEEAGGCRVHPDAWHGIKACNDRIRGLPADFHGLFVIEESRFDLGDRRVEKHYLFLYEETAAGTIRLTSCDLPPEVPREVLNLRQEDLEIDFASISVSPRFQPLELAESDGEYAGSNVSRFSPDLRFHFALRVTPTELQVTERLERDGQTVAGYSTPIVYRRVERNRP